MSEIAPPGEIKSIYSGSLTLIILLAWDICILFSVKSLKLNEYCPFGIFPEFNIDDLINSKLSSPSSIPFHSSKAKSAPGTDSVE